MTQVIKEGGWASAGRVYRSISSGPSLLWVRLRPIARLALVGMAAATVATAVFLAYLPGARRAVIETEGRAIAVEAGVLATALSDLGERTTLAPAEDALVDEFMDDVVLGGRRVGAKLWSLDSVILYSHSGAFEGQRSPTVEPWIKAAIATGLSATVSELGEAGDPDAVVYDEIVNLYVPLWHPVTGAPIAVLEVEEDRRTLAASYTEVATTGLGPIWLSFSMLALSLAVLIGSTVRSVSRERVDREARAIERTGLVQAADNLAASLEVDRLFAAIEERVRPSLGLTRFSLVESEDDVGAGYAVRLHDGRYVVADRVAPVLTEDDKRVIHSCARSLDAALSNAALYEQVRRAAIERGSLLRQVAVAHEQERRRLVGELHDTLAGQLLRALYAVRQIEGRDPIASPEASTDLAHLEDIIAGSEALLREFMEQVRPPSIHELGLAVAIEDVLVRFGRESGIRVRLRVRGDPDRLDPEARLALFRAAEEALMNVRKHAGASAVQVALITRPNAVDLVVDDDGRGLADEPSAGHRRGLGLAYMRERAEAVGGRVRLARGRLGGTRLVVEIPVSSR